VTAARVLRHRLGQTAAALVASVAPPDDRPALSALPPALAELYLGMAPEARRHGLDVRARLLAAGHDDDLLLQTALLHDVGKAHAGITVLHRAARVLLARRAAPVWRWLSVKPTGWRRPFWVLANHAERGAELVEASSGPPDMAELIRLHEQAMPCTWAGTAQAGRHAALAAADAVC
jgi:hypothetical protein